MATLEGSRGINYAAAYGFAVGSVACVIRDLERGDVEHALTWLRSIQQDAEEYGERYYEDARALGMVA